MINNKINKLCFSFLLCLFSLYYSSLYAQGVGINEDESDPDESAMLDVKSTTRGMLVPRMSEIQKNAIIAPIKGLLIYQNTGTEGFYYFDGLVWKPLVSTGATTTGWALEGNAGTNPLTNFVGTTDARDLAFRTNNITRWRMTQKGQLVPYSSNNGVLIGWDAGNSLPSTGFGGQVYIGYFAGSKDTGTLGNVGIGYEALKKAYYVSMGTASGGGNTAVGYSSMSNTTGAQFNVALGGNTLQNAVNSQLNVVIGYDAMKFSTGLNASNNVAIGSRAIHNNDTGRDNVAVGYNVMGNNSAVGVTGEYNVAVGSNSMHDLISGDHNIAIGATSLHENYTGSRNISIGHASLYESLGGSDNVALGHKVLFNFLTGRHNTVIGTESGFDITEANNITLIGSTISLTGIRNNIIALGSGIQDGQFTADNQIALGNTSITAIRSQVSGITTYSDKRFKTNIKEDVKGLDFIMRLRPVTYNVRPTELHKIWGTNKKDMEGIDHKDIENKLQMGFIAQEVEQAAKETGFNFVGLDVPKSDKEVYTLRYTDFIMPLVKSVQELKQQNDILQKENEELKAKTNNLETKLNEVEKLKLEVEAIKAQLKGIQ